MDEGKPPKELARIIQIIILFLLIPATLFLFYEKIGIFLILGMIIFFFIFSFKDKKLKKTEEDNFLKKDESWFISKYKLSEEIP